MEVSIAKSVSHFTMVYDTPLNHGIDIQGHVLHQSLDLKLENKILIVHRNNF